ncbi:MAG: glycoside hydrolase family 88 protein [Fimbriimonas sp.]|nr:glycoside hydrolase family 88 protein [Fimbriimonas sp.]
MLNEPLVKSAANAALALQRRDWEQGVVAQAFLELGAHEVAFGLARAILVFAREDGRLAMLTDSGLADSAMIGEALYRAATQTGDPLLVEAEAKLRHYILVGAPRTADGTLHHLPNQVWVDSHHCAGPYLAAVGEFESALSQFAGLKRRLWNEEAGLFHFQWDEATGAFADASFWGVGNGWAAAGLTRVIRSLPSGHPARPGLIDTLSALLAAVQALQRPDGFFHNVLDDSQTFVELNAGQMFAFAIYEGMRGGWLPESLQRGADLARKASHAHMDTFGLIQPVCGAPMFDRPGIAAEGQAFFLMMEAAATRLHSN